LNLAFRLVLLARRENRDRAVEEAEVLIDVGLVRVGRRAGLLARGLFQLLEPRVRLVRARNGQDAILDAARLLIAAAVAADGGVVGAESTGDLTAALADTAADAGRKRSMASTVKTTRSSGSRRCMW